LKTLQDMSQTFVEVVLRAMGVFYIAGAVLVVRMARVSEIMDQALAAISGEAPNRAEQFRQTWLMAGAVVTGVGGLALLMLLDLAFWIMVAAAAQQALYIGFVAPRWLDPLDPPDPTGRQQTRNAFVVYGVATALVGAALGAGLLRPWQDEPGWLLAAAAMVAVGGAGVVVRTLLSRGRPLKGPRGDA
jgi:hypothetical protein